MAAAKAAILTFKDSLHEQELKRIIDPILAATKRTILRTKKRASGCKSHQIASMELASLIRNSAMVVELTYPMALSARKDD